MSDAPGTKNEKIREAAKERFKVKSKPEEGLPEDFVPEDFVTDKAAGFGMSDPRIVPLGEDGATLEFDGGRHSVSSATGEPGQSGFYGTASLKIPLGKRRKG